MKRKNVLLLMTDQHRFDALGCYGNEIINTPNFDRIAAEGTVFTAAYTACPSCVPARAELITGMNQWNTGILGMGRGQGPMGVNFDYTLPGELAKAGYHTQGIGKMHFYPQRSLNGFHNTVLDESGRSQDPDFVSDYRKWFNEHKDGDYDIIHDDMSWNGWTWKLYHGPEFLHPNNWTVNESIEFLKKRDRSMPFFLKTSFARPHSPYDAVEKYYNMYKDKAVPSAAVGEWAHIHDKPEEAPNINTWRGVQDKEDIHNARASYYGNVTHIDNEVGRLLDYMEAEGLLDDTIIIFTSDHGDMLGDHNMWRKTYAYEGSAHIPMLVRLPKDMQNNIQSHSDAPVMIRDIMPTILDALDINIPATVDGKSMLPLVYNQDCDWREYAHGEHCTCYSEEQEMQYVTDGKYKYIWFPRLDQEQFFDLTSDPYEINDLSKSPSHQELVNHWRNNLIKELEPRNAGLVENGQLVSQKDKEYLSSPNYKKRLEGASINWLVKKG